ncbi:hypothetical protein [Streptomyces malaysiensis]|uniref:hypothetical protein n=1 Tax=Streptomyces malaysiensis TaxID=92644 RepID=UPI0033DA3CB9
MITAVAGIGGVVFTGIATYYGARVSADQLEQSREDTGQKARDQAAHVAYWVDAASDGKQRLHVMNRSPDPVSQVYVSFILMPAEWKPGDPGKVGFALALPSVPPCSGLVIDQKSMRYRNPVNRSLRSPLGDGPSDKGWKRIPDIVERSIEMGALLFTDRDGVGWRRTKGELEHARRGDRWSTMMPSDGAHDGAVQGEPPVQAVKSCGSDAAR